MYSPDGSETERYWGKVEAAGMTGWVSMAYLESVHASDSDINADAVVPMDFHCMIAEDEDWEKFETEYDAKVAWYERMYSGRYLISSHDAVSIVLLVHSGENEYTWWFVDDPDYTAE